MHNTTTHRTQGAFLVAALAITASACSSSDHGSDKATSPAEVSSHSPAATSDVLSWGRNPGSCPGPQRATPEDLPASLRDPKSSVDSHKWTHKDGLWTTAPSKAQVTGNSLKFGVVTLDSHGYLTDDNGKPKITAQPANGEGKRIRGHVGNYAEDANGVPRKFWPTTVTFPSTGCWKVVLKTSNESLRFNIAVR